jgi:hypothetical protein
MTTLACRVAKLSLLVGLLAVLGCGKSYVPPGEAARSRPAAPLGRVVDLDVLLPELVWNGKLGAALELTLEIAPEVSEGSRQARYRFQGEELTDLGPGVTFVREAGGRFETGRIGPLRLGDAQFELLLEGAWDASQFGLQGRSWESQSARSGSFTGWRRHRFLVTETDFSFAGSVTQIELVRGAQWVTRRGLAITSPDPALAVSGASAFVINRLSFDNLQRLDPDDRFATVWQRSMGQGSNPHDVLWLDAERVLVSRYEPPFDDLAVVVPSNGRIVDTIDLAGLATNGDGTPRPDQIIASGDAVFVALQNIDRSFTRYGEARLAVLDRQTLQLHAPIALPGKNPGALVARPGRDGRPRLYVALAGIFPGLLAQELSGGVAVVDVNNRVFEKWAIDDDRLGGNVAGLVVARESLGYVLVSTADYRQEVHAFDPERAEPLRVLARTAEYIPEIELDSGGVLAIPVRGFDRPEVCFYAVPTQDADLERDLGCVHLDAAAFAIEALD